MGHFTIFRWRKTRTSFKITKRQLEAKRTDKSYGMKSDRPFEPRMDNVPAGLIKCGGEKNGIEDYAHTVLENS